LTEKEFLDPPSHEVFGICKVCHFQPDCSSNFEFCPFDGQVASKKYDKHIGKCKHTKFLRACAECHLIFPINTFDPSDRMLNFIVAKFDHIDDRAIYTQEILSEISDVLEHLIKNNENKYFLEDLAEYLWNFDITADDLEFLKEEDL
jgi:hypothetical protein